MENGQLRMDNGGCFHNKKNYDGNVIVMENGELKMENV